MNNYEYIAELDAARNSQTALVITLGICTVLTTVAAIGLYISLDRTKKQLHEFRIAQYREVVEKLSKGNDAENGTNEPGKS